MSTDRGSLADAIRQIGREAAGLATGSGLEPAVAAVFARLDAPLRVAIAGRTKAGKSTLLNALVGERLAATDASECTKIVTWYRHALGYSVAAELAAGTTVDLPFRRADGALQVDLGQLEPEAVERIAVGWPAGRLTDLTLIDTPGLGSANEDVSARTTDALIDDDTEHPAEADAVIYLVRHLHRYDAQFLEAFIDHSLRHASPINAIVVLSRADEIGAARPDALVSAGAVAERYAADRRIRDLASGVVPVAGLIAETGATLREAQVAWLRQIAALDETRREALLRSVDRFRDPELNPLAAEIREELLDRLGLFGLRLAIGLIVDGRVRTATDLSQALLATSGIAGLQRILDERFAARSDVLKARSALAALRAIADELVRRSVPGANRLGADIERVEAGSEELALLRLLHLVLAGAVVVSPAEEAEIERLTGSGRPGERVGLAADATLEQTRATALAGIDRWRARAASPLSDRRTVEAAEIVIRAYERIHATPTTTPVGPAS